MTIRYPARAGSFYEASPDACRRHVEQMLDGATVPDDLPSPRYGGIVPHAGWAFSGVLACQTFKALAETRDVSTFVLFGADHTGTAAQGELFDAGAWQTPLGEVPVDEELASEILDASGSIRPNPSVHAHEHSLEVQVPIIQVLCPNAKILPLAAAPGDIAVHVGREVAQVLAERAEHDVTVVGSTDLTHHGGHFPAPGGRGEVGEEWTARNDARMIELMEKLDTDAVIPEASEHRNACGSGAIAATLAACRELGASEGRLLEYTNSFRIMRRLAPERSDDTTVGYASMVFV